jgi:hypothetical protein
VRVPVAGCSAIFGALGACRVGPGAMTSFFLLLSGGKTFIVRRPYRLEKKLMCAIAEVRISLKIDETTNLSRRFWSRCQPSEDDKSAVT